MKNKRFFLWGWAAVLLAGGLALAGCDDSLPPESENITKPAFGPGVYVVGNYTNADDESHAGYWRDGTWYALAVPVGGTWSMAGSYIGNDAIAVSGKDVYICGMYVDASKNMHVGYWLNGTWQELPLPAGAEGSGLDGIAVSGSNVYVAGIRYETSGNFHAGYWLNGTWRALSERSGAENSAAFTIAVSGSTVAIGGYCRDSESASTPCYWLNGTRHDIESSGMVDIDDIAISGGKVHAVGAGGNENGNYYIDGVQSKITGRARCIAVSGDAIYMAGSAETGACYWLNGNRENLTQPIDNTSVEDISVSGGVIHAAGDYTDGGEMVGHNYKRYAYYWRNNAYQLLSTPGASSWAVAVAVVTE